MERHTNEGKFRVYYEGLDGVAPELGCVNLEVNPEAAVARVKTEVCAYDLDRMDNPITYEDVVFINGYPKDCMNYSEVDATKYYYNTVHKLLYKRDVDGKEPWIKLNKEIFNVEGNPAEEVTNPRSGIYYCDTSVSSRELQLYTWNERDGWKEDKKMVQLIMSPIMLGYDPEKTDYSKLYYDMSKHDLYELNPFVYLAEVNFKSNLSHLSQQLIYERPLRYIDEFHTKSFDVNDETRIDFKDIIYISKDPNKYIKNPVEGVYYRDVKEDKWYVYKDGVFRTLEDDKLKEFGVPIYVQGVPEEVIVETPVADRPYVNRLTGKVYMYNGAWTEVGSIDRSHYHPSKDWY